jgi:predicted nucleotidyltransferase
MNLADDAIRALSDYDVLVYVASDNGRRVWYRCIFCDGTGDARDTVEHKDECYFKSLMERI